MCNALVCHLKKNNNKYHLDFNNITITMYGKINEPFEGSVPCQGSCYRTSKAQPVIGPNYPHLTVAVGTEGSVLKPVHIYNAY